jgi:hypothetical protein
MRLVERTDKELWTIRSETGEELEDMSPEEQFEFFRREVEEVVKEEAESHSHKKRPHSRGEPHEDD